MDSIHAVAFQSEGEKYATCEECDGIGESTRLLTITFGKKAEREPMEDVCVNCDEEELDELLETK